MSITPELTPELPLSEQFQPEYLLACGILPLRLVAQRLEVATCGSPDQEVLDDLALSYSATPVAYRSAPPLVDEDRAAVLALLGLAAE